MCDPRDVRRHCHKTLHRAMPLEPGQHRGNDHDYDNTCHQECCDMRHRCPRGNRETDQDQYEGKDEHGTCHGYHGRDASCLTSVPSVMDLGKGIIAMRRKKWVSPEVFAAQAFREESGKGSGEAQNETNQP